MMMCVTLDDARYTMTVRSRRVQLCAIRTERDAPLSRDATRMIEEMLRDATLMIQG